MTTAKPKAKPAPSPAEDAAQQIEQTVAAGTEAIETAAKAAADAVSKGYEKAVILTKDQVQAAVKAQSAAFRSYEDVVAFAKDNLDAVVKSVTILSQGSQEIGKAVFTLAQNSVEEGVAASKALAGTKTLRDLAERQADLAKASIDKVISETTRLSELSAKVAEDAAAPITERINASLDRLARIV